jgi:hypothetical protein
MKRCHVNIGKIIIALVISVIFMSTHAIGDIAPPNAQGETMQPINVTDVQMVNETVHIDLCVENATVKCNFTLMNPGENESLLVGFPVGLGWEEQGEDPYTYPLEDFKAYVNSQPVETREMDVNGSPWMVWDMSFDEMEIKDVDVSYWVPLSYYGNYGRMGSHWFTYVLKTGAAWGGVIEEANIAIVLHDIESDQITELTPDGYVFENNIITWNFTSLEPTENIYIRFETLHEERYTIPGFVSDENHAGIPDATVEFHYWYPDNSTVGGIIDDVYGEPLVTTTSNGTGGAVGWYNLTNLSDDGADWIDVVVVARVLDAAGNERMGISDPVNFCPFHGWYEGAVNITIDLSAPTGLQDRSLAQIEGQPEVYWLQNGSLYWVTDWNVINDMSGVPGWDRVNTLPASEFNPAGYPQGPRFITTGAESDGLLIREQGHPEVYLISGGEKHHFTSPEALLWNGHSFDDVIAVSAAIIGMFPSGSDISITQAIINKYNDLGGEATFGAPAGTGEQSGYPDSSGVVCSYVNFQNGAIEYFTSGDYVGNAYAILNPFFDKWASMGYGKSVLGYPISDMSDVQTSSFGTPSRYQKFINGTEEGSLEYNLTSGEVFAIHGAIYATWDAMGYSSSILGLVTSDEREAVPSFKGTTGRVSDFENGHLHWHSSGEHEGVTYVTYGELDDLYVSMGGTASWLGFPVMDQEERDGHGYCEFEGGYIEWDGIEGKYKAFPIGKPDLSIQFSDFYNDESPFLPNVLKIDATVKNEGNVEAENVKVKFTLNGEPIGVGEIYIGSIKPGADITGYIELEASSNIENGVLKAETSSMGQIDNDISDNTITQPISLYWVDFHHDRDAFWFENWAFSSYDDYWNEYEDFLSAQWEDKDYATFIAASMPQGLIWNLFGIGGHCYGMAASSSSYYLWPNVKPVDKSTFNMEMGEVKPDIIERNIEQVIHIYPLIITLWERETPYNADSEYKSIAHYIKDLNKPINLMLYTDGQNGGHSVTAYKILDIGDDKKRVFVYENNLPYDDPSDNRNIKNRKDSDYFVTFKPLSNEANYAVKSLSYNRVLAVEPWKMMGSEEIIADIKLILGSWFKELWDEGLMTFRTHSPVTSLITDEHGRRIGYVKGILVNEIPGAEMEQQLDSYLFYLPSNLDYSIEMTGTDTGKLGLDFIIPISDSQVKIITYEDIPVVLGSKVTTTFNTQEIPDQVTIDTGDVFYPKSMGELDASDISPPPASITHPHSTAAPTWLNWTWTTPPDPDFNHTEIYLNGVFQTITPSEHYNATDLTPETTYTISTRTVDTAGNINQTWMNDTATTLPSPGTTIQLTISLDSGWNLISAPPNLTTWELGEEAAVGDPLNVTPENSLTSIYRYNTTSELFEKCTHYAGWGWAPATGSESFTELEPGRGYWVMAANDCDLTFTGTAPSDLDIPLDAGWNCVGWYSTSVAELGNESLVGDPLSVTLENSLTSIYRYNTTSELFEKCTHYAGWGWAPATGSESFTELEPGRGYWVMAENDCLWEHEV